MKIGKKSNNKIPEINGGSMADIAFLMLIFFMVTTTIDQETGLQRKLPEKQPDNMQVPPINRRNVFQVLINSGNQLLVNNEPGDLSLLKERVKEFYLNPKDDPNLSAKQEEITKYDYLGDIRKSKGIVSLQNDRLTSFERYMEVQDVLVRAFNEMRNDLCQQKLNMTYWELQELVKNNPDEYEDKLDEVQDAIPMAISEAEPKKTQK